MASSDEYEVHINLFHYIWVTRAAEAAPSPQK